jgi:hypothetical protein
MKDILKRLIDRAVQNDFCWWVLERSLIRTSNYAYWMRNKNKTNKNREIQLHGIRTICPDLRIKHGPFKGISYPDIKSVTFAKVFGSYEKELHVIIENICMQNYNEIVNIGCAEGYYAVGLAKRIPTAKVYAYDINEEAIKQCEKIAFYNGVKGQIITSLYCNTETLKSIPFTGKVLIISDCEGYEKELFTKEIACLFLNHDFIIEVHDSVDITISSYIRKIFEETHDIEVIQSIDDIKKAQTYCYEELEQFNLETKKILLAESRRHIMEWYYIKSRKI